MGKLGIIVGAAPIDKEKQYIIDKVNLLLRENVYIIAADGGIELLQRIGITPDEWVGDMDSVDSSFSCEDNDITTIKVSPIKDETDMELAIERALRASCTDVLIFGGMGGSRMEHTLANIQLIYGYAKKGIGVRMISKTRRLSVLVNNQVSLGVRDKGYVSIFSLSDVSKNVSISGLFYEYQGDLINSYALGVSNEFNGNEAIISVKEGALLIVEELPEI